MKPTLDRHGTLRFPDGPEFLAPKVSAVEPVRCTRPLELSGSTDRAEYDLLRNNVRGQTKEWSDFLAKLDHTCKSGACQHAHNIRCRCQCHGKAHRAKMLREYHSIEEYGDKSASEGALHPPLGALARPMQVPA